MAYQANAERYSGAMPYRFCGKSGLQLPAISLGLWHNFGDATPFQTQRDMLRTAFDLGITHFDLANNYGPPAGSAETHFGEHLRRDFRPYRDELIISSKAGWAMWPGPYGQGGGSRKYLLASLDQSLKRMGLDYVDIFYSHRFDPDTPLEETMGALASAVQQGKALYVGISSYSAAKTREAAAILKSMGVKALIHQPSYSLLNRWIEEDLLNALDDTGMGCIAFSALAQGLLPINTSTAYRSMHASTSPVAARSPRTTSRPRICSTFAHSTTSPKPVAKPWHKWPRPGCCGMHASRQP